MHILFFTPQLPHPPHQGTTIRNYHLIRLLAVHHKIDLVTFLAPGQTLTPDNPLHMLCRRIVGVPQPTRTLPQRLVSTFVQRLPDMALRLESADLYAQLQELASETNAYDNAYDIVQVEGIEMAQYGLFLITQLAQQGRRPQLVFDNHNCEYLLQKRNALTDLRNPRRVVAGLYSVMQWLKLRAYEARICRQADVVLAVSEPDRAALQALVPEAGVAVIANGIDPALYQQLVSPTLSLTAQAPATLVFTGKMDYRPNIDAVLWFADNVLPLIMQAEPHVRFQIVGMNPHPRLDRLRANPAIEITGAVESITPYLDNAGVYVVPLRIGGGTRFKVLEAMAQGLPIVSTTLGVEGIGVTDGQELLLADRPEAFAQAVLRILADREMENGLFTSLLSQNALTFVTANYSWSEIVPRLEIIYQQR